MTLEDLVNLHVFVVEELIKRGLGHREEDDFDRIAGKFRESVPGPLIRRKLADAGDHVLIPAYVSVSGSFVQEGSKAGDVDIIIRQGQRWLSLEALLVKLFGKDIAPYLEFVYEPTGPHDDHMPVYDLVLRKRPRLEVQVVEARKFVPLVKYTPPKMGSAYSLEEFYDIEQLYERWAKAYFDRGIPIAVEKKENGFRAVLQHDGKGHTLIYFEDAKINRSKQFPKLTEELRKLPAAILDAEIGAVTKSGHIVARKELAGWGQDPNKPVDVDDFELASGDRARILVHVFDLVHWDGQDLSGKPWMERRKMLEEALGRKDLKYLEVIPTHITRNKSEFVAAVKKVSAEEMSEGAVCKATDSLYSEGEIPGWAKMKKLCEVKLQVLGRTTVKGQATVWNYDVGYLSGGEIVRAGKTFNTDLDAREGQIMTVGVEEVIPEWDEEHSRWLVTFVVPRPRDIDLSRKKPESAEVIIQKAAKAGILQVSTEELRTRLRKARLLEAEMGDEGGHAGKWEDDLWQWIEPGSEGEFVIQEHEMGLSEEAAKSGKREREQSIHTDLRLWIKKPKKLSFLVGVALATPGNTEKPSKILNPDPSQKILVPAAKKPQPLIWLDMGAGKISDITTHVEIGGKNLPADVVEPGGVGASKNQWARFVMLDRGKWRAGVQDEHFKEFWFEGERGVLKGRWIFQYVPVSGFETPEKVAPKGEKRVWMLSRPEDQKMRLEQS